MAKYVRVKYGVEEREAAIGNILSSVDERVAQNAVELIAKGLIHELPQEQPFVSDQEAEWGTAFVYSGSKPEKFLFSFQLDENGNWVFEKLV